MVGVDYSAEEMYRRARWDGGVPFDGNALLSIPNTVTDSFEDYSTGSFPSSTWTNANFGPAVQSGSSTPWGGQYIEYEHRGSGSGSDKVFYSSVSSSKAGPLTEIQCCSYEWDQAYNNGFRLYARDSDGNMLFSTGDSNPQVIVEDADGSHTIESSPNPNYQEWRRFTVTIDWETNTFDLLWEDITGSTGDRTWSGPLMTNVGDVAEIGIMQNGDDGKRRIDQMTRFV